MDRRKSALQRHPLLSLVVINLIVLLGIALILEVFLRLTVDYRIDFYVGRSEPGVVEYPYGRIVINSDGYADEEFNRSSTQPRIGYFGDSVTYGVGAGYPYRISEYLEKALSQFEHWNLSGGVGGALNEDVMIEAADEYDLKYAVYLLNLNDIFPLQTPQDSAQSIVSSIESFVRKYLDFLRSKSHLYNYTRTKVKVALQRAGFVATGYSYELWPNENEWVLQEFAARLNEASRTLAERGRELCVVLLPYEMQISENAAQTYREMGFEWEDGFELGSTQAMLLRLIDGPTVFDPQIAFDREAAKVGEYFVYNKGDKIDWNHPNGEGHRVIAESIIANIGCPFVGPGAAPLGL